jgi:hypothetical protein
VISRREKRQGKDNHSAPIRDYLDRETAACPMVINIAVATQPAYPFIGLHEKSLPLKKASARHLLPSIGYNQFSQWSINDSLNPFKQIFSCSG